MRLRRYELEGDLGSIEITLEKRTLTQRKSEDDASTNTFDTVAEAADEFVRLERIYARRGKLIASEDDVEAAARPQKLLTVLFDWLEEQGVGPANPDEPQPGPRYFGDELWPLIEAGDLELVLAQGKLRATVRTINTLSQARRHVRHMFSVDQQLAKFLALPVAARLTGLELLPTAAYNDGEEAVDWDVKRAVNALANSSARESVTELHLGSPVAPNLELASLPKSLSKLVNLERLHLHSKRGVSAGGLELPKLAKLHIDSLRTLAQSRSFFELTWPSLTTLVLNVNGAGHAAVLTSALNEGRLPRLQRLIVKGLDSEADAFRAAHSTELRVIDAGS